MEARPPEAPAPGTSSTSLNTDTTGSLPAASPPVAAPTTSTASSAAAASTASAPLPGTQSMPNRISCVISLRDAQNWIEQFKNRPASTQTLESLNTFYEWLLELLDEHNRLASVFAKNENTQVMSETEKQTASKFNHLKIEALLLKAELLIKLNRYAEAIVPLVDIVNAEPSSTAGKEAYKDLQDIGFSEIPDLSSHNSTLPVTAKVVKPPAPKIVPPKYSAYHKH